MSGKRLNPFQHALKRPDTYVGSVKTVSKETYVLEEDSKISIRNVKWNTGLMNIIREIGSNCIDNAWRSAEAGIKMSSIKVTYDSETKEITFWNDGYYISAEKKTYEYEDYRKGTISSEVMYPAEVFFGEMLAGTNFDDEEERKTSGRNGMGAKCLAPNTRIPMWDGSYKLASEIKIGDKIIGDNGTVRFVKFLIHGKGQMFRIDQQKGLSYEVNYNHVLSLYTDENLSSVIDISVRDYISLKVDKSRLYGMRNDLTSCILTGSITVTPIGCGEYVGFEIEGDNERFLINDDHTITHNCTNIFSTIFNVKHTDPETGKTFEQQYSNNAKNRTDPKLTTFRAKNGWTQIRFRPDFELFNYDIEDEDVEADFIGLLGMYVLEIAAVTAIPVVFTAGEFENKKFWIKTFEKYARMFYPDVKENKMSSIILPNKDECVFVESHVDARLNIPDMLEDSRHLSYVNGVKTKDGGVHVEAWRDAVFPSFVRAFNARKVKASVTPVKTTAKEVFPYLTMFIRTEMDKPSFDTQTKDRLNGPDYHLYPTGKSKSDKEKAAEVKEEIEKLVKKMLKWNFVSLLEEKLLAKTDRGKNKKVRKRVNLGDKAQDANMAGKHPEKCTLYITEGLSAKAMVVRGISTLENGQDYNGAFAVQGKFINVVNASASEIAANEESNLLKQMLNIRIGVDYSKKENFNTLRYHKVCLTTDMDDDGIHIRGLLINFIHSLWPELVEMDFIVSLSTAVAKVTFPGKKEDLLFYSTPEYKRWYEETGLAMKIAEVKYLKGLGSINPKDVPGYFSNPRTVCYFAEGDEEQYMELGFDENASDWRKEWLLRDMNRASDSEDSEEEELEIGNNNVEFIYDGKLGISTFVDTQLIIYHRMALRRALPNSMDGFKESQRKAFYAIRERNYNKTKDLEKVMGAVKELTGYHHGGASLLGTIKNMAIRYPGSNNIALLQDDGEFGCIDPETPVLLYEKGSVKAFEVKVGDILVGDDYKPRHVTELTRGMDKMYDVIQGCGGSYRVNSCHVLTLKLCYEQCDSQNAFFSVYCVCDIDGYMQDIFDMDIKKYLSLDDDTKSRIRGVKVLQGKTTFHTIKVVEVGQGEYCGWEIDGNKRFLLGDGTVTHNTRLAGGKDSAAARYIATALEDVAKAIFPKVDDALLKHVVEDNEPAEFEFFLPVICMLLVNGADGIASGFSTTIPNHNPEDILAWTRSWLDGTHENQPKLIPWYRGITGSIELEKSKKSLKIPDRWRTKGVLVECQKGCPIKVGKKKCRGESGWWHITDLPVGKWTNNFKEHLEYLESGSVPKGKSWKKIETKCLADFRDYSTANLVHFMIKPSKAGDGWDPDIDVTLKQMQTTKTLRNMVAIDANNYPTRYKDAEDILNDWCPRRLRYYNKRHKYLLDLLSHDLKRSTNKYNYVKAVVDKKLNMYQNDEKLEKDMKDMKLEKMTSSVNSESEPTYDYLLSMQMRSMTLKKLNELLSEKNGIQKKIDLLMTKTGSDLWREDLDAFEVSYKKYLKSNSVE